MSATTIQTRIDELRESRSRLLANIQELTTQVTAHDVGINELQRLVELANENPDEKQGT